MFSWKKVANAKTRVQVNVGMASEVTFTLPGVAENVTELLALTESVKGPITVRRKAEHHGANADKKGGTRFTVSGQENGLNLSAEIQESLGMAVKKNKGKAAKEEASPTPEPVLAAAS